MIDPLFIYGHFDFYKERCYEHLSTIFCVSLCFNQGAEAPCKHITVNEHPLVQISLVFPQYPFVSLFPEHHCDLGRLSP